MSQKACNEKRRRHPSVPAFNIHTRCCCRCCSCLFFCCHPVGICGCSCLFFCCHPEGICGAVAVVCSFVCHPVGVCGCSSCSFVVIPTGYASSAAFVFALSLLASHSERSEEPRILPLLMHCQSSSTAPPLDRSSSQTPPQSAPPAPQTSHPNHTAPHNRHLPDAQSHSCLLRDADVKHKVPSRDRSYPKLPQ
jgi:hypothetical protein